MHSPKNKVYFIIGASGSGKTTILHLFHQNTPHDLTLLHFDSIGVPSFALMEKEYGSIEEWQRMKTIDWMKKIKTEHLSSSSVLFDAQIRPSYIEESCNLLEISFEIVLFDCSDEERKKRLFSREQPELAGENMMQWAAFLRKESQTNHYKIIDNSHMTEEETLSYFTKWLQNKTRPSIASEIA